MTVIIDNESPPGSWAEALRARGIDPHTGEPLERKQRSSDTDQPGREFQGMADGGFKPETRGQNW